MYWDGDQLTSPAAWPTLGIPPLGWGVDDSEHHPRSNDQPCAVFITHPNGIMRALYMSREPGCPIGMGCSDQPPAAFFSTSQATDRPTLT
eukprot:3615163-Heterocapsa_arctica.AAC.1